MSEEAADVVVVGGGGTGLAAAIAARSHGARVLLLEKNAAPGGSTAWSIGSITATGTPHQHRRGIEDSPDAHFADMALFAQGLAARDNDPLRRILCEHVLETFAWLLSLGVRFYVDGKQGPHQTQRLACARPKERVQ